MRFIFGILMLLTCPVWAGSIIRVRLEYIETVAEDLSSVISHKSPYGFLLEKLKSGKASRYNTELLLARSGETATVESILEITYPTESDPDDYQWSASPLDYSQFILPLPSPYFNRPPIPVAFETRNTGFTLEIQPVESQRGFIDLRFSAEEVGLQRVDIIMPHQDDFGRADIAMPVFESNRSNLGLTLIPDQPQLVSTFSPRREDGSAHPTRRILLFVTASPLDVS